MSELPNLEVGAKCRVLLVDDSPAIRQMLRLGLAKQPHIEVVGEAEDAYVARERIKQLNPDVITLDVEMPRMNGLDFLERIMRLRPMPVVMLSSVTNQGSVAAVRALSLGAVDVQVKPSDGFDDRFMTRLAERLLTAGTSKLRVPGRLRNTGKTTADTTARLNAWNGKIVLMGASTGGVAAIESVLRRLPSNTPPVVIAQHMPASFLSSFVERLSQRMAMNVQVASDGVALQQGTVYLAPGGMTHTTIRRDGSQFICQERTGPKINGHHPSVDALFLSAVDFAEHVIGVILTGLGRDGADGLTQLKCRGAQTIGQDEASCVVYGMPRAAFEAGAVGIQLPLERMASKICSFADRGQDPIKVFE